VEERRKMISNDVKYNYDSELGNHAISSFKSYFYIACFMFLSFRLLTSLTGTAYADSATDNVQNLPQSSVTALEDPKNISGLELLRADVGVDKSEKDTKSRDRLRQIIEQIRSVEFKPQQQAPERVVVPEKAPAPVIEPNETVPEVPLRNEEAKQQARPEQPYESITEETLQVLRILAQEPEKLDNPLELGETVFAGGNVKEASMFYREALKRKDPNDLGSSGDRAWILFQIGNCLRNDDLPAAAKAYQQLLTEYPNSPWAEPAKAQGDLIAWYLKDEPAKLMLQVKDAGSQKDDVR
jgi:tetratricopeptide (TPR) repeat protein